MAEFFEIRSGRERDGDVVKRTFQAVDAPNVTLFVWQTGGQPVHLQLLFEERFAEWSALAGLSVGRQVRERERGVRSLLRDPAVDYRELRELLARHRFPEEVITPLREALEAECQ